MESIVVDYLAPILVFSVLSFIILSGILFVLLYCHLNCPCDSKDENKQDKKVVLVDKIVCGGVKTGKTSSVYFCDFVKDKINELSIEDLHISLRRCLKDNLDNYGLIQELFDDVSVTEGAILELNDRLNLVEIEIKNIKKVGKKNGSKK